MLFFSKNTVEELLDIAEFWSFLLYFMGIFGTKKLLIVYAHYLNKTKIRPTNRQVTRSADARFLNNPLNDRIFRIFRIFTRIAVRP